MVFVDLENRRGDVERHRENSGRLAQVVARYHSSGQGSIEFTHRVDFGLTFITKPMMQYGSEIDLDDLDERLDLDYNKNQSPPVPLTAGYVTSWDRNSRGYYVGAFVGARVYYPPEDLIPRDFTVEVIHHYRFTTVAMKDVPVDLTD